jgi:uncharacterized protein
MPALVVALGVLVGLTLGAVGAGGSILTVPILVYALSVDVHSATGTALLIVGSSALVGTVVHTRAHRVQWRDAAIFGLAGALGAVLGSLLNHQLPGPLILGGLATLMLLVALRMWTRRKSDAVPGARRAWPVVVLTGSGVGVLTGLFGVGGGFLLVPALVLALGLTMSAAVATSLPVIAFNSAAGFIPYAATGRVDYHLAALFIVGGVIGMLVGAHFGERAGNARLQQAFAALMVLVAGYLILQQTVALAV